MVTTAASSATSITTFFRRKDVVLRITNFLSIKNHLHNFSVPYHTTFPQKSNKKILLFGRKSGKECKKEITLDLPTTHFGGQGLFLIILGFNHWLTSLSTVSTPLLFDEIRIAFRLAFNDHLLLLSLYHRKLRRSVSVKRCFVVPSL